MDSEPPITELLHRWDGGDEAARDRLFALLYDDLHALAHQQRQKHRAPHTLNTTALVHEVYLKLAGRVGEGVRDREHLMALTAKALRCVIVDYARRAGRQKRGGEAQRVTLDEGAIPAVEAEALEILTLDEVLTDLAALDAPLVQTVEMHFFAGLSYAEVAEVRGVSRQTVYRTVLKAKALLRSRLNA